MKLRPAVLLLILSSITAFALSVAGLRSLPGDYSLSTCVYLALQMFTFQGGEVEGEVPLMLEIGRFLAPATTLGGVYAAAHAFFRRLWGQVRLRSFRGHTVICGGGDKGSILARELAATGERVVLIDPVESAGFASLRAMGIVVLCGEGGDSAVHRLAGLDRAARLVCFSGDDRTNIGMAMAAAAGLPPGRASSALEIHVHVAGVTTRDILQRNRLFDLEHDLRSRVRLFNCFANRARLALAADPLEWDAASGLHDEAHLVVGALGPFERALVVHAAQTGHFRNGGRVVVHLLSKQAKSDEACLRKEYPGFTRCADLRATALGDESDFVEFAAALVSQSAPGALVTVVRTGPPESAVTEALLLAERVKDGPVLRVLIDAPVDSGIRTMVEENADLLASVRFFPEIGLACGAEAVFGSKLDRVARHIHEVWKAGTDRRIMEAEAAGDTAAAAKHRAKETYRDWDALTEQQKDVNRLAADHLLTKVRALGLDPGDRGAIASAWKSLAPGQIEMLARMEHERWAAPLAIAGWIPGSRNDDLRTHPNLVPYDELDQGTKDYDIEQVMAVPLYLGLD
jgi:hypothetical protein